MDPWIALAALLIGYLLGSLSFARLIGGIVAAGEDLTRTPVEIGGSHKQIEFRAVSASSIAMRKGPALGCLTSALDALKVFLPTLAFRLLYPQADYYLLAAAAGVAGHNYPIYYRFKGGLGISPLIGALLAIDPLAVPASILVSALVGFFIVRDLFFAYGGMTLFLIPWFWFRFHDLSYVLFALLVCLLFWTAAVPTLRQYLAFKRAGEFSSQASLFQTGHTASLLQELRKRGILKSKDTDQPQSPQ
jgi:glycerol-3-phosphate acyltransferase PlsY